jgi:pimeloyl-ACP methyl ester carboxylesterase
MRFKRNYDFVQCDTKDGLILSGLLTQGDKSKPLNIFIHGFEENFYGRKFYHSISEKLESIGRGFILIETRGSGSKSDFLSSQGKGATTIGSHYERLEEAYLDIDAWIKFLKEEGYNEFNLIGWSLGTIKAVRYLSEGEYKSSIKKLILLAPFDKNGPTEQLTDGHLKEYVVIANEMIKQGKGEEIIPPNFDEIPISYKNYASWYADDELGSMWDFYRADKYEFPAISKITIPTNIIVGSKDSHFFLPEFNTLEGVKKILVDHIKDLKFSLIEGSPHSFTNYEDELSNLIAEFINE